MTVRRQYTASNRLLLKPLLLDTVLYCICIIHNYLTAVWAVDHKLKNIILV